MRPDPIILLVLLCLLSLPLYADEEMTFKAFSLSNADAEAMVEMIKPLLSPGAVAIADKRTNSVIVKDYPCNLAKIEEFIKEADKPLPNVRIKVRFADTSDVSASGIVIKSSPGGWNVGVVGPGSFSSRTTQEMSLIVMDGREGNISSGNKIAYVQWFYNYAFKHGYIAANINFIEVSTGFVVKPKVRGSLVEVNIYPQISYFSPEGNGVIVFKNAGTSVLLRDGDSMVISGSSSDQEDVISRILQGFGSSSSHQSSSMILTVKIEQPIR